MTHGTDQSAELPLIQPLEPTISAMDAFLRLATLPHVVFFDSAMRHPTLGRYSFVSADPIEWITSRSGGDDGLSRLAGKLPPAADVCLHHDLPPFQGGWAGLFGYELGRSLETVPAAAIDEFNVPALAVGCYDVVVAFDHARRRAWLISQGWPEVDPAGRRERAAARLADFHSRLMRAKPTTSSDGAAASPALPGDALAPQFAVSGADSLTSNFSPDGYHSTIQRAIDYIYAGDVFQVNLSQRLLHPAIGSSVELYCRLRERNPAPFAGFLDGGIWQIASASPERFVCVDGTRVETRPIKGTRRRARRPEADLFAGDELRASDKDRAENIMIVDLLRNDLSRTCRPGSIRVSQLCGLETYEYVQHLVSVVEAERRAGCTPLDVLQAAFPGGSVTGAPKIRAMEIIAELEPTVRGPYCGAFAYIGLDGRMDSSILIRTITATRGWWQLPVGGGIVAQSNPHDEYEETWHKAAGMLRAIKP